MDFFSSIDPDITKWVIIPFLIFCARLLDVSIGTLRIVFIARGERKIAPILGFFEVLIWIIAMGQVMQNLSSPLAYLGWAAGFAVGNYVGLVIEQRLALGQVVIRVISTEPATALMEDLSRLSYKTIIIDAESGEGKKNVLFSIVKRKNLEEIIVLVKSRMPQAFYTIEGIQQFSEANPLMEHERSFWYRRVFPVKKSK